MSITLKSAGGWFLRFTGFVVLGAILELMIVNLTWLNENLLPWFFLASTLALAVLVFVALPLSIIRPLRRVAGVVSHGAAYVLFAAVLMWAVLVTLGVWGKWAVFVGLFLMVIGVVPVAMLAALFTGAWSIVIQLLVLSGLTLGARAYARWIHSRGVAPVPIRE